MKINFRRIILNNRTAQLTMNYNNYITIGVMFSLKTLKMRADAHAPFLLRAEPPL